MSPSLEHQWLKTTLARLLQGYADEVGLEFNGFGSMTMRRADGERGAEPDECYVIGRARGRPDLAIEVIWTSGGLDKSSS
jgi:Uma2 family endonuclease